MDPTSAGPQAASTADRRSATHTHPPHGSPTARKRSTSGPGSFLSRIPFLRVSGDQHHQHQNHPHPPPPAPATGPLPPRQKTRKRRGSLRKVALLGRGALRERREARCLTVDTHVTENPVGLGFSDATPRPSMDAPGSSRHDADEATPTAASPWIRDPRHTLPRATDSAVTSPTVSCSTTDDEDGFHMAARPPGPVSSSAFLRPARASVSSGSEACGYFSSLPGGFLSVPAADSTPVADGASRSPTSGLPSSLLQRRRSAAAGQRARSPLALTSLAGPAATTLPPAVAVAAAAAAADLAVSVGGSVGGAVDWDYAETEFWGWVVLAVTWLVFVTGMGSCLGVWSWAWDVGRTPDAPPELSDDHTLPIVGYYPALLILTAVMAWVWVVVAWVGMKYFRHARVSGD
ncbi:hypothetical protein P8C59_008345 [Phyllachora maydis]|uniref:Uncharacterized protein n=1 Tax=Phyllachora maydis TaxID=1825666 RepID=A0AAD9MEH4_9PEZI|nr:hypothetical protein P8C59_008345 [Phyllachora maydis]